MWLTITSQTDWLFHEQGLLWKFINLSANYFQEKVSHLGPGFGGGDVNFFLKFNSAKSSVFFCIQGDQKKMTLPYSLCCLETKEQIYTLLSD